MTSFLISALIAIAVYTGVAVYVLTRRPRRTISWVFGAYCACVVGYYVSHLCLLPGSRLSQCASPLRWSWAIASAAPVLFLHLTSFYWPAGWHRYRLPVLAPAYLVSALAACATLLTDLVIAGALHRPCPSPVAPVPGPLMSLIAAACATEVLVALVGLLLAYRRFRSRLLRRQVRRLFPSLALLVLGAVVVWLNVLTSDGVEIPRQLIDATLISAGILLTRAVLRYGALTGRPASWRRVVYAGLGAAMGLGALYVTMTLDHALASHTAIPYPLITGIIVLVVAIGGAPLSRWATHTLDRVLFPAHRRSQKTTYHMLDELSATSDPERLQAQLLEAVCTELDVLGGYVALPDPDAPSGELAIDAVCGKLPVAAGNRVPDLPESTKGPQLVSELPARDRGCRCSHQVALVCPLSIDDGGKGLLALGTKRNAGRFTDREIALCREMARQLSAISRMVDLRRDRDQHVETAHLRERALQELEEKVSGSAYRTLESLEGELADPAAPMEIRVLGPLEVGRRGQPIPESEWGTKKAKTLLALLLWKGEKGATRDEILAALWPRRSTSKAANVFHVTLHRLRHALEPGLDRPGDSQYVVYEGGRYRFNRDAPCWVDSEVFKKLATRDDEAPLRRAVALYRGPYLADVDGALPAQMEIERRALERLYADVLRKLVCRVKRRETIPLLEKLVAVEPGDEAAQRALVLGYMARGRPDLVRRHVARWRETWAALGRQPPPETEALWWQLEDTA